MLFIYNSLLSNFSSNCHTVCSLKLIRNALRIPPEPGLADGSLLGASVTNKRWGYVRSTVRSANETSLSLLKMGLERGP